MSSVRRLLGPLFISLLTIVGSVVAFFAWLIDRSGDRILDLARLWSRIILGFSGVKLEVEWHVPLDPRAPYVFMANHASSLDIWTLLVALPIRFRMIAKKQLGRIPFFGWAARAGRFIFIDRANAVAARRSIEVAKERIRGGQSVLIFPEGTRTRDGRLGAFKKGGFHLAIDAGVPIVPVALIGTGALMPRGSLLIRGGRVRIIVGQPIPTEGVATGERNALVERVRGEVSALLGDPQRPEAVQPSPGAAHGVS